MLALQLFGRIVACWRKPELGASTVVCVRVIWLDLTHRYKDACDLLFDGTEAAETVKIGARWHEVSPTVSESHCLR